MRPTHWRTILSAAMMLRLSLKLEKEAAAVEQAVGAVLEKGYRTMDILDREGDQKYVKMVGTSEMTEQVIAALTRERDDKNAQ